MEHLLFGHNDEQNIVAVHTMNDNTVRLYKREHDTVSFRDEEFFPFFHLSDKRFIEGFSKKIWLKKLEGNNFYQYVCAFPTPQITWEAIQFALRAINRESEKKVDSYTDTEHILFRADMNTQFLMQSGTTLFKGMQFEELYRMQIDIETYSKSYKFSRADKKDDRIILIALSDNRGWEKVIGNKRMSEQKLIEECINIIKEKDPDVLEGHNIYNFDLPYILERCELLNIEFSIGRDNSVPTGYRSRTAFAERDVEYISYEVAGRHIIDTWLLVQAYDAMKRTMESHGLKYAAKYFGIASPTRTYIEGDKISWYWDHDPEILKAYSYDDVRETRLLSDKLSGSNFYVTQMLPFNYGTVAKLGSAAKIESLFMREYLRQRASIPKPTKGIQTSGGYTDIFYTGIFETIVHADVESLYPSIMLSKNIYPNSDVLHAFPTALKHLTELRIETKNKMKTESDEHERSRLDAMQSSFKILINSFYGYLGYSRGLFNDYEKADSVTTTGQEFLRSLMTEITLHNGKVIEVDTDGIFFVPPDNVVGEHAEREFVQRLSSLLPEGINLAFDGRYKKILSYKKKNYALLGYEEKIKIKGSSLISRSIERYGRNYIQQCIECLLHNRIKELHELFIEVEKAIREHTLDIKDFAKTETLKDSLDHYQRDVAAEKRNHSASYELALHSSRNYKAGDKISYYITGKGADIVGFKNAKEVHEWDANFPDENTQHYLKRLEEFSEKFSVLFQEREFQAIFSAEDLFGFNAEEINIRNEKVEHETKKIDLSTMQSTIELDE